MIENDGIWNSIYKFCILEDIKKNLGKYTPYMIELSGVDSKIKKQIRYALQELLDSGDIILDENLKLILGKK